MTNYARITASLIAAWFIAVLAASAFHVFKTDPSRPPLAVGLAALLPIVAFSSWFASSEPFRRRLRARSSDRNRRRRVRESQCVFHFRAFRQRHRQRGVKRVAGRGGIHGLHRERRRGECSIRSAVHAALVAQFHDHGAHAEFPDLLSQRDGVGGSRGFGGTPASTHASFSFGVAMSTSSRISFGRARAGAGSRMHVAPTRRASRKPSATVSSGTSSCSSTQRAPSSAQRSESMSRRTERRSPRAPP
jgi:hypothetical protein